MPLTLVMHGIPLELVDKATYDQLLVMQEIVNRDVKNRLQGQASAVNRGVFGTDKK